MSLRYHTNFAITTLQQLTSTDIVTNNHMGSVKERSPSVHSGVLEIGAPYTSLVDGTVASSPLPETFVIMGSAFAYWTIYTRAALQLESV